ncbi:MAG: PilZ domain-containing protein [Spirochaetota bacterium]
MALTTIQQISRWYEGYKTVDVSFTKEIVKAIGLEPRHVYLKCLGEQWPCVIYSTSFAGAKIIATSKTNFTEKLQKANSLVSLRFSFRMEGKVDPVSFFIQGRVMGCAPYTQSGSELQFMTIEYTQQPPDDLIDILGQVLEANASASRRREDRVLLTPDMMRKMSLLTKDTIISVQGVPRKCIIRDLSFSGAKIIIMGLARFLVDKECNLRIDFEEPRENVDIKGSIIRFEEVEGRKDLAAVAVSFDEALLPLSYKIHLNACLSQTRPSRLEEDPGLKASPLA